MKIEKMLWEDAQKEIENGVVYLEFTTNWCGDCIMMKPVVEEVASHFKNNSNVRIINVDAEEAQLFRVENTKFEVLKVPTHLIMKDGEILFKDFEYTPKEELIFQIEEALK